MLNDTSEDNSDSCDDAILEGGTQDLIYKIKKALSELDKNFTILGKRIAPICQERGVKNNDSKDDSRENRSTINNDLSVILDHITDLSLEVTSKTNEVDI